MSPEAFPARTAELQRFGFKFFVENPEALRLPDVVPVFHRWIQIHAVEGLLIDVADYSHVYHGPGVLLVAHEGNYALDLRGGRLGLAYWRKQSLPGSLLDRLAAVCRIALDACAQLETAPEFEGRVRFRGEELLFLANDRLRAPNTHATQAALSRALGGLLRTLYGDAECDVRPEPDAREPLTLSVKAPHRLAVEALRARLAPV